MGMFKSTSLAQAALVFVITVSSIIHCQAGVQHARGIHVPIVRKRQAVRPAPRAEGAGSIGLGDFEDITYSVEIQVGGTQMPVVLDTGSSDLWVLSTACRESMCPSNQIPLYAPSTFRPDALDAQLIYGDSRTGTYADGLIGSDFVSLAGLGAQNQHFCAINATNTSVLEMGSAGIFGLGFPFNSLLWIQLSLQSQNAGANATARRDAIPEVADANTSFPNRPTNLATRWFRKDGPEGEYGAGEPLVYSMRPLMTTAALRSSIDNYGPLIPRLAAQGVLDLPMFSIALQRDTIQIGGNEGMLSIGQLPPSVPMESLTWVNVRGYPVSRGGLKPPSDALGEVYPVAWEIPVDDVWFDGVKLSRSKMSSPNISLSALIDTGNSLIRGPPDVVKQIQTLLGGPRFACSRPHSLMFQIGGKQFPVDPRDFIGEARPGDPDLCVANVVSTDVPPSDGPGYLYSWNLGDPFLKGVLVAFHYGSLTRPSENPPRVGLLSTVDYNAAALLCNDQQQADSERVGYPMIAEPAPFSLPPAKGTGVGGVPLAPRPTATQRGRHASLTNGGSGDMGMGIGIWVTALTGFVAWTTWRVVG